MPMPPGFNDLTLHRRVKKHLFYVFYERCSNNRTKSDVDLKEGSGGRRFKGETHFGSLNLSFELFGARKGKARERVFFGQSEPSFLFFRLNAVNEPVRT